MLPFFAPAYALAGSHRPTRLGEGEMGTTQRRILEQLPGLWIKIVDRLRDTENQ